MTTNLQAYRRSNNLGVGDTNDLNGNSEWSKTNENFGGFLKALRRDHQGGTLAMSGTDSNSDSTTATVTESSSGAGSDLGLGGGMIGGTRIRTGKGGRSDRRRGRRGRGDPS